MARISRRELKTDRFAVEVGHTVEYVERHSRQIVRYAVIAGAVLVAAVAVYYFLRQSSAGREREMAHAMRVLDARVGPDTDPNFIAFPTKEAKDAAIRKELADIVRKHPGSDEGIAATYLLGARAVDDGKLAEAEKYYKQAADSGNKKYGPLAKMGLGQIYLATGRTAEGEKMLRDLVDHPAELVSKDEASMALARAIAKSKPQEARKLLEGVVSQVNNPAVSRAAVNLMGELFAQ